MKKNSLTLNAAFIITGNEILSGEIKDENLQILAKTLQPAGIKLSYVAIIEDSTEAIYQEIIKIKHDYSYIFVSGGVGPTHDDVTVAGVGMAFGAPLLLNKTAYAFLQEYYGSELTKAHLKMAYLPKGCKMIKNPVSAAPGFRLENVYVISGVPSIFKIMLNQIVNNLEGGQVVLTESLSFAVSEGQIAHILEDCLKKFTDIEIGSYPYVRFGYFGTEIIVRSYDDKKLALAKNFLEERLDIFNGNYPNSA